MGWTPPADVEILGEDSLEVQVYRRAHELMREFGLVGWRFDISHTEHLMGQCDHEAKLITLSMYYLHHGWREIEDTLRHEIAHALTSPQADDHGDEWKYNAVLCGASPKHCADSHVTSSAKPKWRIRCPHCGWSVTRFRMKKCNYRSFCPKCGTRVKIFRITWKKKKGG